MLQSQRTVKGRSRLNADGELMWKLNKSQWAIKSRSKLKMELSMHDPSFMAPELLYFLRKWLKCENAQKSGSRKK